MVNKNPPANEGDARDGGLIPGSGRSPGVGNAIYSSILVWKIPRIEEPGRLHAVHRVSNERSCSLGPWG